MDEITMEESAEDDPGWMDVNEQVQIQPRPARSGRDGPQQSTLTAFFQSQGTRSNNSSGTDSVRPPSAPAMQEAEPPSTSSLSQEDLGKLSAPHAMIWHYFAKCNKNTAKCKVVDCGKLVNTPTGATTLLIRHLVQHSSQNNEYTRLQNEKKKIASEKINKIRGNAQIGKNVIRFPLDPRGDRYKTITRAIALFICKGLKPFSVVEEKGFVYLLYILEPRYVIPSRFTFARKEIPNMYKELKRKLYDRILELKDHLESVCFTIDIWTSRKMKSFIAFTIQFLNLEFQMERFTLECQPFPGCHDAAAICQRMQEMILSIGLEDEGIEKYVVSDNGSNMLAALEEPSEEKRLNEEIADILRQEKSWEHEKCFNHTAQLAINDTKKELAVNNVIDKISHLVTRYHRSKNAMESFLKFQEEHGLPKHELVQRVKTRWDSDFIMLDRAVEQKAAIVSELSAAGEDNLTSAEWKLAEGFVQVLRPVANHTAELGSEKGPTASMIIPVVHEIESELEEFVQKAPRGTGILFARKMLSNARSRFSPYKSNKTCIKAMLIDPRYKDVLEDEYKDQHWPSSARIILEEEAEVKYRARVRRGIIKISEDTTRAESSESEPSAKKSKWKFLQKKTQCKSDGSGSNTNDHSKLIKDEVESYLLLPVIDADNDPLKWWKANESSFPNLALVARHYLGIAATETASERVFSVGSNTVTPKRTNLSSDHLKEIIFCHDNAKVPQMTDIKYV